MIDKLITTNNTTTTTTTTTKPNDLMECMHQEIFLNIQMSKANHKQTRLLV